MLIFNFSAQLIITILSSDESYVSCQNYFCRLAKFDEDILNYGRNILQVQDFQDGDFDFKLYIIAAKHLIIIIIVVYQSTV